MRARFFSRKLGGPLLKIHFLTGTLDPTWSKYDVCQVHFCPKKETPMVEGRPQRKRQRTIFQTCCHLYVGRFRLTSPYRKNPTGAHSLEYTTRKMDFLTGILDPTLKKYDVCQVHFCPKRKLRRSKGDLNESVNERFSRRVTAYTSDVFD